MCMAFNHTCPKCQVHMSIEECPQDDIFWGILNLNSINQPYHPHDRNCSTIKVRYVQCTYVQNNHQVNFNKFKQIIVPMTKILCYDNDWVTSTNQRKTIHTWKIAHNWPRITIRFQRDQGRTNANTRQLKKTKGTRWEVLGKVVRWVKKQATLTACLQPV